MAIHDKSARYDRQLRLWGEDGQARVENTKVLLLNANATGAETLKNLVLPGIGSFTIVDGKKVEATDTGNNFFVTQSSIGQPRAKVVTELLKELNEFVNGNYIVEDPVQLIEKNPNLVKEYTFVIASALPEAAVRKLSTLCTEAHIPLVVVKTYGLLAYLRSQVEEHRIVESKRENIPEDLCIFNPFPELLQFANSFNLATLSDSDHSHVPYPLILIQHLNEWRAQHGGAAPKTSAEKAQFKQFVSSKQRKPGQENYEEAIKAINRYCFGKVPIRPEVIQLMKDPKVGQLSETTPNFWILVTALKEFVENEGAGSLPQAGIVPDIHSYTNTYMTLQAIYQEKATKDLAVMMSRVNALLAKIGRHGPISEEEVKHFCKNGQYLQVLRFNSIEGEYSGKSVNKAELKSHLENDPQSNVAYYVLLRACDRFFAANQRHPGAFDDEVESDIHKLKAFVSQIASELEIDANKISDDQIHEVCRFGGSEPHSIAAFLGGVSAQEVIKIITNKWVPANNTYIYNGMLSTATTIQA